MHHRRSKKKWFLQPKEWNEELITTCSPKVVVHRFEEILEVGSRPIEGCLERLKGDVASTTRDLDSVGRLLVVDVVDHFGLSCGSRAPRIRARLGPFLVGRSRSAGHRRRRLCTLSRRDERTLRSRISHVVFRSSRQALLLSLSRTHARTMSFDDVYPTAFSSMLEVKTMSTFFPTSGFRRVGPLQGKLATARSDVVNASKTRAPLQQSATWDFLVVVRKVKKPARYSASDRNERTDDQPTAPNCTAPGSRSRGRRAGSRLVVTVSPARPLRYTRCKRRRGSGTPGGVAVWLHRRRLKESKSSRPRSRPPVLLTWSSGYSEVCADLSRYIEFEVEATEAVKDLATRRCKEREAVSWGARWLSRCAVG